MNVKFSALEYTGADSFADSVYGYTGSPSDGWVVLRNGAVYLKLGPGYRILKTRYCGICSTDLSRQFLPFRLPQIIGHEVIAADPDTDEEFVVEINDSCIARGDPPEIFCKSGLPTHCPGRMVLGIDRLPGGFGPFILAPIHAAIPCKELPSPGAVLVEPFAAALHAVTTSEPRNGDRVAVLGAGRLGLLITAALSLYRKSHPLDFRISVLGRHSRNCEIAGILGADEAIDLRNTEPGSMHARFDIVYDASGSVDGFETALDLARREVHLKSTHGREFYGVIHLTELVVDELSLLPYSTENMDFHWRGKNEKNKLIFVTQGAEIPLPGNYTAFRSDPQSAAEYLHSKQFENRLPRYDLCVAASPGEIDDCIRPDPDTDYSLIRPRGAILFQGKARGNPLMSFLLSGGQVRTSRCGDFNMAIELLKNNYAIMPALEQHLITHIFSAAELPQAFETAKYHDAIKVIIQH